MANDIDILFPERSVTLTTGEVVEVHEFSMREGMQANAFAYPLIAALENLFDGAAAEDVGTHLIDKAFGEHADIMLRCTAMATGKPQDWLDALNDEDGQRLTHAVWSVNKDFFIRRLVQMRQAKNFHTPRSLHS